MAKKTIEPVAPGDEYLAKQLGKTHPFFLKLTATAESFAQEWKYYGAKYGWTYKVSDRKKALFWLTPVENGFRIGLSLREEERESLLQSDLPDNLATAVREAMKSPEGFGVRLEVRNSKSFQQAEIIVNHLIRLRGK